MAIGPFLSLVLLSFFFGKTVTTASRKINFGQCELNSVSLRELRDHFGTIKETIQTQDNKTDVILLNGTVLQENPVSESCCLFHRILRFYTETVFKHYEPTNNLLRRKTSTLANSILSIKATLKKCHDQNKCTCGEESHRRFKLILTEYEKLAKNTAAIKALGEMDILFAWMEDIRN
ncbi:interleukin-20-like [Tiliqua scincoides]|uniref:interleukin-20-like n=1 Tax=Tiliqua scincoides TaxID=71010 RepID=UPI003462542E